MKALRDLEPEVLPDGGRRLWWLIVPVHQTYLYISHYIIRNIHESEFYIRWMQRMFSRRNWVKSACRGISRLWGIPERDSCMQIEEDNLVENFQCTAKAWWRFPITSRWLLSRSDFMMTEEVPHGYVPVFQLRYTLLFRSTWSLHSVPD